MAHPWVYRVVWPAVASGPIPHPGQALHRTEKSVRAHAAYLRRTGARGVRVQAPIGGAWEDVG